MSFAAKPPQRVAYTTFGCRLNQYDTESIRTLLERSERYQTVESSAEADIYVVNTCSVTARADATARKAIRRLHDKHPEARIVVTGCYAQRAPQELAELPGVSLIIGAADRGQVVAELEQIQEESFAKLRISVSPVEEAKTFLEVPVTEMMERTRAFVKIQEGCNESCSFCIVPQTRGASRSRDPGNVLAQAQSLIEAGYVELVLTGVHIGDYGLDLNGERQLSSLIKELLSLSGLERLRLSSIEPASITSELIELMATEEKFSPHFHIPFQSGSDRILKQMRRRYSAGYFQEIVERISRRIPGCGIGVDVICGFPGETDEDFAATFDMLTTLPITYVHPFTYSTRPGSQAQTFSDQVPGEIKKRRTRSLKRLSQDKLAKARQQSIGCVEKILIEQGPIEGRYLGWTGNYLRVSVSDLPSVPLGGSSPLPLGLIDVEILGASADTLLAKPI